MECSTHLMGSTCTYCKQLTMLVTMDPLLSPTHLTLLFPTPSHPHPLTMHLVLESCPACNLLVLLHSQPHSFTEQRLLQRTENTEEAKCTALLGGARRLLSCYAHVINKEQSCFAKCRLAHIAAPSSVLSSFSLPFCLPLSSLPLPPPYI